MQAKDKKMAELILYISAKCEDDDRFGSVKLNKILFYSDFIQYGKSGASITGQDYRRLKRGPGPTRLLPIRNRLVEAQDVELENRERFGLTQIRTVALRGADLSGFSSAEIALVDDVIGALWDDSATDVSEVSHRFPGWKLAEPMEEIPYQSVFLSERELTSSEREFALELG